MKTYYFEGHCYECLKCGYKELKYEEPGCTSSLNYEMYRCEQCKESLVLIGESNGRD